MTESDWLASDDLAAMLRHVGDKVSARKLRLFPAACCRQVWDGVTCIRCSGEGCSPHGMPHGGCDGTGKVDRLTDTCSRNAVEVAERHADGDATERELAAADQAAVSAWDGGLRNLGRHLGAWVAEPELRLMLSQTVGILEAWGAGILPPAVQADLLRCIVGNPFRPVVLPAGCPWLTDTVRRLAGAIYADHAFDHLPILADALEEAGCPVDEPCIECWETGSPQRGIERPYCSSCPGDGVVTNPLLSHLRGPGPHVRGCWCVDLLLGKE